MILSNVVKENGYEWNGSDYKRKDDTLYKKKVIDYFAEVAIFVENGIMNKE